MDNILLVITGGVALAALAKAAVLHAQQHQFLVRHRARRILHERLRKRVEPTPPVVPEPGPQPSAGAPVMREGALRHLLSLFTRPRMKMMVSQLEQSLVLARIPLKGAEFLYISIGALVGALALVQVSTAGVPTTVMIALVAGMAPFHYLRFSQRRRLQRIDAQVADALLLVVNSLRAGATFMDAMDAVANEMPPPICDEFARNLRDVSLGTPVEDAFARMSARCRSEDLELAVTAFMVQRDTGGNLSEILDNIAATIRDRTKLKHEIRTLSAQGRLSGMILCSIPIALALVLQGLNPGYLKILTTTPEGKMMLLASASMQLAGVLSISRIIKIDA